MVLTNEKRALMGDRGGKAKRLTDAGVLLPCPMCRGKARVRANATISQMSAET